MHEVSPDYQPDRPGLFQVHIEGVGHLKVFLGFERVAELRGGELLPPPIDVLAEGPVRTSFRVLIDTLYKQFCQPTLSHLTSRDEAERTVLLTICDLC